MDLIYRNQRNHILENADKLYVDSIGLIFLGKSQKKVKSEKEKRDEIAKEEAKKRRWQIEES